MIPATNTLISYLIDQKEGIDYQSAYATVQTILRKGSFEDAKKVLAYIVNNPADSKSFYLFPIIKKWGNEIIAEQIFRVSVANSNWNIHDFPEILELLGYFRYEPVKKILEEAAFTKSNYYTEKYAVLGLLYFNCKEYQTTIKKHIDSCLNKGMFPEYIPALVCKLEPKERDEYLDKLYDLGANFASTDCNAGIILGFSLSGEKGASYFRKILFDKHWETEDFGTGTVHATYQGTKNLKITFQELYQEVKTKVYDENSATHFYVFVALIELFLRDPEIEDVNAYRNLYELLFSNREGNLQSLAAKIDEDSEALRIKSILEQKLIEL